MKTCNPCFETLSKEQKQIWKQLFPALKMGFTLYGGTAVALQIGHRHSVDFDFFSDVSFPDMYSSLKALFLFLKQSTVLQNENNTLIVITDSQVKISFFGNISFGRVGTPLLTTDNILQIASLDDLMATKLAVVQKRVEIKDYQDIAAMIKHEIELAKGIASARLLYGNGFVPSNALKTLTYFHGVESLKTEDKEILIQAVRCLKELPKMKIISKKLTII